MTTALLVRLGLKAAATTTEQPAERVAVDEARAARFHNDNITR